VRCGSNSWELKGTIYKLPQRTRAVIWQLSIIDVVQFYPRIGAFRHA